MLHLSEHLSVFRDTCNVYVVRSGREAVLIDFGNGDVLDVLEEASVDRVTGVLMTHHHRDQAQGLHRAAAAGIPIWVPSAERGLFDAVDIHWQAREAYNNYNVRQDRFSLLEPVPVAGELRDYATSRFGDHDFQVLPTPGHTIGSVTLLAQIDGRSTAFSGDLIYAPGKVWSLSATQWSYNGGEGVAATILSLLDLEDRQPDWLLPSHGDPIQDPPPAIEVLVERLRGLLTLRRHNLRLLDFRDQPYEEISPHLLRNRTSLAYGYVLLTDSGKALFIDYGYDFSTGLAAPVEATPELLGRLEERGAELERLHWKLLPLGDADLGAEGFAAWIQPYQAQVRGGDTLALDVEVRNPHPRTEELRVRVAPDGWKVEPAEARFQLESLLDAVARFRVSPPVGLEVRRARVAAELTVGDESFGQQAEALVTVL